MEHNEYVALEQQLQTHFDERYVMQTDCSNRQEEMNKRFANDDKRIDLMLQKWNIIEKLLWAVVTTTIGILAASIFGLILK
jgi:hypothetical protein